MNIRRGSFVNKVVVWLCLLVGTPACLAATTCGFVSGGGVAFGPYDTLSAAPTDSALDFQVSCSRSGGPQNISVTVSLGIGTYGTSVSNRRMAGGSGDFLSYGLFRDVSRSGPWGFTPGIDAVSQTIAIPNNGSVTTTFTVFGRIPPQQDVSQGLYSDVIQVTLSP
jgi:spore coat protein U-like protein